MIRFKGLLMPSKIPEARSTKGRMKALCLTTHCRDLQCKECLLDWTNPKTVKDFKECENEEV